MNKIYEEFTGSSNTCSAIGNGPHTLSSKWIVDRIDSEINSRSPLIKAATDAQLSTEGEGVFVPSWSNNLTLDGGREKIWQKHVNHSCSNHPPQAVPQRRYMVVDGLGVAGAVLGCK